MIGYQHTIKETSSNIISCRFWWNRLEQKHITHLFVTEKRHYWSWSFYKQYYNNIYDPVKIIMSKHKIMCHSFSSSFCLFVFVLFFSPKLKMFWVMKFQSVTNNTESSVKDHKLRSMLISVYLYINESVTLKTRTSVHPLTG